LQIALFLNVKQLVKQRFRLKENQEWISTGGFILAYLALGSSHYQLPHYIFVAFPLAAIVTAVFFRDLMEAGISSQLAKVVKPMMLAIPLLMFVGVLMTITFPSNWIWIVTLVLAVLVWLIYTRKNDDRENMVFPAALGMILVNVFLTHYFYFELMKYQVGTQVGKYIHDQELPVDKVRILHMNDPLNSLHFYAQGVIGGADTNYLSTTQGMYFLTQEEGLAYLQRQGGKVDIISQGKFFKVSQLTPTFLNHKNRPSVLKNYFLVSVGSE
jgi:hypothetical protein